MIESIPDGPHDRIKIGVVTPHDMALDHELWRWMPEKASLHIARTAFDAAPVTLEMVTALGDAAEVRDAAARIRTITPAALAFACTSGSFVRGSAGELEVRDALADAGGAPAVSTSGALALALERLGVGTVAIATPYDEAITARLVDYLAERGVRVTAAASLGLDSDMWTVPYRRTAELVRSVDSDEAQAIVLSCTNLPTYDLLAPLEAQLGKPVISANQATMWAALGLVGLEAVGPGQSLLAAR